MKYLIACLVLSSFSNAFADESILTCKRADQTFMRLDIQHQNQRIIRAVMMHNFISANLACVDESFRNLEGRSLKCIGYWTLARQGSNLILELALKQKAGKITAEFIDDTRTWPDRKPVKVVLNCEDEQVDL